MTATARKLSDDKPATTLWTLVKADQWDEAVECARDLAAEFVDEGKTGAMIERWCWLQFNNSPWEAGEFITDLWTCARAEVSLAKAHEVLAKLDETQAGPGALANETEPAPEPLSAPLSLARERARRERAKAEPERSVTLAKEPEPEPKTPLRLIVDAIRPAKSVPGIVGEIVEFTVNSAMYPSMKFATAMGIGVVGTLISRRIAGPSGPRGCGTHLYQALIGATGVGKEHTRTVGKLLLDTAAAAALIGPGRFKSGPALVKHIEGKPVSLCFMDELGAYFEKLSDPRATGWEREITEVLREIWGLSWGRYDSPMGAHDESKVVMCPALSIVGLTTPKELYRACKSREVSNGYLNRWNFIEEQDQPEWQKTDALSLDVPKALDKGLKKLYQPVSILNRTGEPAERLEWGPGAEDVYHAIREEIEAETDDRKRELCWRSAEKTVRVATILAAGCFSSVVTREHMEWARDWVLGGDETLMAGVSEYMEEEKYEFGELCKEIIRRVRRSGGSMLERQIKRSFQNNVRYKHETNNALQHLLETDQLVSTKMNDEGRPSWLLSIPE